MRFIRSSHTWVLRIARGCMRQPSTRRDLRCSGRWSRSTWSTQGTKKIWIIMNHAYISSPRKVCWFHHRWATTLVVKYKLVLIEVPTGKAWTSDYGDPHDPHDFDFIHPISPVHNVPKDRILPPTILLTADREYIMCLGLLAFQLTIHPWNSDDDRVVPLHSFKHAATLQYTLPGNPHPLLIRIDKKTGHGAGKATEKKYVASSRLQSATKDVLFRIIEAADKWGFIAQSLGLRWKD